jgi:hypothetical protein
MQSNKGTDNRTKQLKESFIVGVILVSFGVAGFAYIFYLHKHYEVLANRPQPPFPTEIPNNVPWLSGKERIIGLEEQTFLIVYDSDARIRVNFQKTDSIKGLWNGDYLECAILTPFYEKFGAESQTNSWGNMLITQDYDLSTFTPWIRTAFSIDKIYYHQWLTAKVKLGISYPVYTNSQAGLAFENKTTTFEHSLQLFVASPEEYQMVVDYKDWENNQSNTGDPTVGYLIMLLCIFPGIWILISNSIALRKRRNTNA